ncbi:MAG: hypothetical protein WC461_01160 [Candidatus Paceibacterota bacterium]
MKNSFIKKTILFLIIFTLIFGVSNIFQSPKKALAVWGIEDVVFDPQAFGLALGNWAVQVAQWAKDEALKALRDAIVKRIMDYMTDQTIAWIQGGGKPQFVTDFSGFLRSSANAAIGDVVLKTNASFICSPFKAQILLGLTPAPKFGQQVKCTLDGIVKNIDDFYKDFNKGGWVGYTETMQSQGNYFGVALQVSANLNAEAAKAVDAASKEVQAGSGFLSVKRCKGGGYGLDAFEDNTPPSMYQKDSKGNYCLAKDMENVTPGAVVGEAVKTAINSDSQWAANVQSYMSAIINALITRLTKEGLSLIANSNSSNENSAAGYTGQYQDAIIQNLKSDQKMMIDGINPFLSEWSFLVSQYSKAFDSNSQVISALQEIKSRSCGIAIDTENGNDILSVLNATSTDSAIAKSNAAQSILKGKVDDFALRVQQSNNALDKIDTIYSKYTNSATSITVDSVEISQAQGVYSQFIGIYSNQQYLEPLTTGSDRSAAALEVTDKANKERLALAALSSCRATSATSTSATSTNP